MRLIRVILAATVAAMPMTSVFANSVAGPYLNSTYTGQSTTHGDKSLNDYEFSRRRTDFKLMVPLPSVIENLQLIPQVQLMEEARGYTESSAKISPLPKHSKTSAYGMIAAYQHSPDIQIFFLASRYGAIAQEEAGLPLAEFITGFNLIDEKNADSHIGAEAMAALRYRRFPHGERWLPLIGYKQQLGQWFYDVLVPAYGTLGYEFESKKNAIMVSASLDSRQEPFRVDGSSYWTEGYVTNLAVAWQKHLHEILYVRFDVGMQSELLEVYDQRGKRMDTLTSNFGPWVQIMFLTLVPVP